MGFRDGGDSGEDGRVGVKGERSAETRRRDGEDEDGGKEREG